MKKTLIAISCGLMLAFSASQAQAVAIGDSDYLGSIVPGTGSPAENIQWINRLVDMGLGTSDSTTFVGETLNRSTIPCSPNLGGCPDAVALGADTDNAPVASVNVAGWEWLLAKYGGDAHVWYVGDIGGVTAIPQTNLGGQGLSHWSLYNGTTTVPDGGATLGLLGLGMLGLGYLRRRRQ